MLLLFHIMPPSTEDPFLDTTSWPGEDEPSLPQSHGELNRTLASQSLHRVEISTETVSENLQWNPEGPVTAIIRRTVTKIRHADLGFEIIIESANNSPLVKLELAVDSQLAVLQVRGSQHDFNLQ